MTRARENESRGAREVRPASPLLRAARAGALVLLLPALAGCCFRMSRPDDEPCFRHTTGSVAERFDEDAQVTAHRISDVWNNVVTEFDETGSRLQLACDLYFGK